MNSETTNDAFIADLKAKIERLKPEDARRWDIYKAARKAFDDAQVKPKPAPLPHEIALNDWGQTSKQLEALKLVLAAYEQAKAEPTAVNPTEEKNETSTS